MRKFYLLSTLVLTMLYGSTSFAQDFSNKGKDFWVAYGYHQQMKNTGNCPQTGTPIPGGCQDMVLYFATDQVTNITISIPGLGYTQALTTAAGNNVVTSFAIPKNPAVMDARLVAEGLSNKGIHVTSDKPIVAYAHVYNSSVSGATILFPTNTLGKEYYSVNYKNTSNTNDANCFFYVVAADTGTTTVEITPSGNTTGGWVAGTTYTVNLTQGQVYNVMGVLTSAINPFTAVDLTGSKIQSVASASGACKRIAVFSGSGRISITCNASSSSSDNYMVQDFPRTAWGKKFLTAPAAGNQSFNLYRVCVSDPTTIVKINGVVTALPLQNGFYYEISQTNQPQMVEADKPITVAQYFSSQGSCGNGNPGDPEVIYLSPVEQNISKVLWNATPNYLILNHYFNVIIPNTGTAVSSFLLDGVPAGPFTAHPQDPGYVYLRQSVSSGPHVIQSDSGFNAIAYGFGGAESYGYNAGTNIKDIFQYVTVQNQYATVNFPATCRSSPFNFSMTFPYQPIRIEWQFGAVLNGVGIPDQTLFNGGLPLVPTSTIVVAGKTLYVYTLATPYTIPVAGTYPIKVIATNPTPDGCGGVQEIDYDLQVFDPPIADFNFATNGCVTSPVSFTDNSNTGGRPVISRHWNFGDAATSNLNNPAHTYAAPGSYPVKYSLITDVGCLADTVIHVVDLNDLPVAQFAVSTPYCVGKQITFTDQSTATGSSILNQWTWDFGDGSPVVVAATGASQVHTYATAGTYNVTLKVETGTGCESLVYTFPVVVHVNPIAGFDFPNICLPVGAAQFSNTTSISDGTLPLTTYLWDFGDGSPTVTNINPLHNYAGVGPYNVILTATSNNGCIDDSIRIVNTIYSQPQSAFTSAVELCLGATASFTDNSTAAGAIITEWFWDFGDATPILTIQNPTHLYASAGTYTVKHWIKTDKGCYSDTLSRDIIINPLPTANFTSAGPYCVTRVVTFTDISVANAGAVVSWLWNFGDATTSTLQNPTHTYTATGTFNVTLQVTTDKGCVSTIYTAQVVVNPLPVPGFTHVRACLPDGIVSFTNTSTIANAAALNYVWDFGDPASGALNTSTATNPAHYFSTVGPYNVTLTVTSGDGCIKDIVIPITDIYAQADGEFTVNSENCLNTTTSFTSTSNPLAGNTIAEWHWDFGDAATSTLQNPTHTYAATGTYIIKHWIVTDKGCNSDTAIHNVVINPLPTGNFNYTAPTCETKVLNFSDLSVPNAGALNGWTWNFGDGSPTSNLQNPTHTYAAAGTYAVTLVVTTDKGCISAVFTRQVIVSPQPVPGYIEPEVCLSDTYAQFIDTSDVATGSIATWLWDFGDPGSGPLNTSALQNPQHAYSAIGSYTGTLTVTTNNGCVATIAHTFTVNGDIPVANFNALNPATLCANDSVAIQDASTVNFGSITKVEIYWDNVNFPGVFQTDDFPVPAKIYRHLYPNFQAPLTRTFTIRYRAYSGATCVNDRLKIITVNAAPKVQFNNIPDICLDAAPYQITQASEIGAVPGTFVFTGPGVSATGLFTPSVAGPGTHTIKYTFTSATGGCVDTLSQTITVYAPPVADFNFVAPFCETKSITFNDNSNTPVGTLTTWTWDFADGSPILIRTSNAPFIHTFAAWGVYAVKLSVTTSNGCISVQKVINITINPQPKPNFTIPVSACLPNASVTFNNTSSIADGSQALFTYLWNFGDPGSGALNTSVLASPTHIYTNTGPFTVNLQVTSGNGCVQDTDIILNTVNPQPLASFTVDKVDVCIGGSFTFNSTSNPLNGTTTQWNWVMDDGNVRNTAGFIYTYGNVGTYNVSLFIFNSNGCRSTTATKTVFVNPYPPVNAGPDKFVLQGGQVTLTPALNAGMPVTYLWSPPTYLNNPAIAMAIASPPDDITYTLKVTTDKGCSATDMVFVKVLKGPEIPNIFSPNADGIHDTWVIKYLETYPGCTVDIFNRYGQLIYHSTGYDNPWDGTVNGNPVPIGTYYYIVNPKNGRKQMSGYVDVIR